MELFDVSFTTRKMIKKFDAKNNLIAEESLSTPVTMTMLPHATAMSYSGCDNFQIRPHVLDQRRSKFGSGRNDKVGNGTKKVNVRSGASSSSAPPPAKQKVDHRKEAARTGNMAGAINE